MSNQGQIKAGMQVRYLCPRNLKHLGTKLSEHGKQQRTVPPQFALTPDKDTMPREGQAATTVHRRHPTSSAMKAAHPLVITGILTSKPETALCHRLTSRHYKVDRFSLTTDFQNLRNQRRWPHVPESGQSLTQPSLHIPGWTWKPYICLNSWKTLSRKCGLATRLPERCPLVTSPQKQSLCTCPLARGRHSLFVSASRGARWPQPSLPVCDARALHPGPAERPQRRHCQQQAAGIPSALHLRCSTCFQNPQAVAVETSLIMQMCLGVRSDSILSVMST